MSDKKILDLILDKLGNLENGQNGLIKQVGKLDERVGKLEQGQAKLEQGQKGIIESMGRLENSFYNFQEETENNFKYVNKRIDQSFEKISDKIEQEEKVDTIFNFLNNTKTSSKLSSFKRNSKKEKLIA